MVAARFVALQLNIIEQESAGMDYNILRRAFLMYSLFHSRPFWSRCCCNRLVPCCTKNFWAFELLVFVLLTQAAFSPAHLPG